MLPLLEGLSQQGTKWAKQSFCAVDGNRFPNEMLFDLFNEKIPETELAVGQHVDVHYSVRTREYNGRVYNEINVWKIDILNS